MKNPNTKELWNEKFKSGSFSKMGHIRGRLKQYKFLLDILPRDKKFSLFEIGCASGYGLKFLELRFPLAEFYGLDFSKVAIKRAKKEYPDINFETGDIQDYKFIRKYNYITIIKTLEHLTKPFAIVDECLKHATNAVIITTPFSAHYLHINLFHLHDFDNYVFDNVSRSKKEGAFRLIIYGRKNI